jgi:hypothetical protein
LDALNNINLSATVGFEDGGPETIVELGNPEQLVNAIEASEIEDEVEFIGGPERATIVHQSIDSIEEVWNQEVKQEPLELIKREDEETDADAVAVEETEVAPMMVTAPQTQDVYVTRSG